VVAKSPAEFRELFSKNVVAPMGLVMLTRERVQEVVDDAVDRGRVTRDDANRLVQSIVDLGRKQTADVLSDLERLLGHGVGQATSTADAVLRVGDRARRTVGVGPNFPILRYDALTAAQITARLSELSKPELRKVRDYERRNANRKTVLEAIEPKLK
jgi:hypothetical protein